MFQLFTFLINKIRLIKLKRRRGSPLVEESILLGLALFAFMILAAVVFNIIDFAKNIFSGVIDSLDKIPKPN